MIINIRGTSGSGKTYTARSFLEFYGPDTIVYGEEDKPVAHMVFFNMMPVYFIGSYSNVCGGCDTIHTQDLICSLVRHFSQFGHVIFEGLIISHSFARYAALWKELTALGNPFYFAYMDTSLEMCLERIVQRRLEKGNTKPLNPDNTTSHYYATWQTKDKFEAAKIPTCVIKHTKNPVMELVRIISLDKEMTWEYSYREEKFR